LNQSFEECFEEISKDIDMNKFIRHLKGMNDNSLSTRAIR